MGQLLIQKKKIRFFKRFLQTDMVILSIITLGGITSLILNDQPSKNHLEIFVLLIITFIGLSLLSRVLIEYKKERRTITKLEISDNNVLKIDYTDFDRPMELECNLNDLDVSLKRSYRRDGSRLSLDFFIGESKPERATFRQHHNRDWDSRDVKEIFLRIMELKDKRLTRKEKDIVDDAEFS